MYVPLNTPGATHAGAADFALAVGQVLERQLPGRVTTVMAKAERPGKIFVDWSQNALHKTTIAPYSLRARAEPTVSTPVGWNEVEACAAGYEILRFTSDEVLQRVEALGTFSPTCSSSSKRFRFPAADSGEARQHPTIGGREPRSSDRQACNLLKIGP